MKENFKYLKTKAGANKLQENKKCPNYGFEGLMVLENNGTQRYIL